MTRNTTHPSSLLSTLFSRLSTPLVAALALGACSVSSGEETGDGSDAGATSDTGDTTSDTGDTSATSDTSEAESGDSSETESGDGDGDGDGDALEIAGSYVDEWSSMHTIDDSSWTIDASAFHVSSYDNDADFLVAENDADNAFSPGAWSRFDWAYVGEALYYCQSAFDAVDAAAAEATPRPDDTDPSTTGCGGTFPWTRLSQ